jgi:hypothetical protein
LPLANGVGGGRDERVQCGHHLRIGLGAVGGATVRTEAPHLGDAAGLIEGNHQRDHGIRIDRRRFARILRIDGIRAARQRVLRGDRHRLLLERADLVADALRGSLSQRKRANGKPTACGDDDCHHRARHNDSPGRHACLLGDQRHSPKQVPASRKRGNRYEGTSGRGDA